ncbi:MAG TPA: hypothetical protein VF828_03430 [Patescibacteria group bacterium]
MKKNDFNKLEPKFPKEAFSVMIFIKKTGNEMGAYPLKEIFMSEKEVGKKTEILKTELKKNNIDFLGSVIIPIKLLELFPLKPEFWDNPSQDYQGIIRSDFFVKMLQEPKLYKLLVLPEHYDAKKNKWWLKAAVPFYLSADKKTIEKFMMTANDVVDPRASHAGIYVFGDPKGTDEDKTNQEKLLN